MNIFKNWREPMSALTHLLALIVFIPILIVLIYNGYMVGGLYYALSFLVFSLSIISLYLASTLYHMLNIQKSSVKILKKIDHMMIFVLIAGTYTPICLINLKGNFGYGLLIFVWTIGIIGIIVKFFWINAPRWISTAFYVIMGWLAILAFVPIKSSVGLNGILLLIFGGIVYTIGALIYATKYPKLNLKHLGFHEIFHLFVIAGSVCFIVFMFLFVL